MAVEALFPLATFQSPGEFLPHTQNWFLPLRWYGLLIATAVLIGLNLSSRLAKLRQLENNLVSDLLPVLVLFAVIGARIYYVAFEWHNYASNPLKALAIWEGGIAIHGALLAGTITLILFCRWRRQPFWGCAGCVGSLRGLGTGHRSLGEFLQFRGLRGSN